MTRDKICCENCEYLVDGGLDFGEQCYLDGSYVTRWNKETHKQEYRKCPHKERLKAEYESQKQIE